ncbi:MULTISPECIES: substrate-binding periplasmic protein [Pseudomonas]|jgi:ABC-type amino acid transport substrate-binding protein|uniref:ABC-type amino acid transport substrate-binding protein n=2 Tax=Pseudomonas fluorescens TaxID=294 RepID=A0ABY1T8F1_PSEFL|nr:MULTISPECIES: transporter substrate-binding domain-containing protein [Pseudomonas]MBK5546921.1 transporter substrate-binding domain-containing protein [Pseudomonas sp. TH04]MCI4603069.1 transporter substrate-binding domain-containing protein [Pseudomonas fluorescens]MDD5442790.1 transporter substrate-binding domain-containing protein [Pseudomonas fluorescens]NNB70915.1 amino acid ABC transporter substrate-binding protein [Pseudomonas fluorescens]OEC73390.1 ABC transporter substrate-binding
MVVRRWLLIMMCAASLVLADEAPVPGKVVLASEEWSNYTNKDGSGLAWDVLRQVFEPADITVQTRTVPYTRSIGLAQRGEVDGWVGAYRDEASGVLYPHWHFDADHIYALGLATAPTPSLATLGNYRLAWVRGYKYEAYLPNLHRFNQIERRDSILPMLQHARVDFYIDSLTEANLVLSQSDEPSQFKLTHIAELPLYVGFADTERGRALMAVYDRRMAALIDSGELKPIFLRWKQPYPF